MGMVRVFPVIHTKRLTLRQPSYDDVGALLEICQDEEVMLYYGMEVFKEEKQSRDEIDWMNKIWRQETGARWVITHKGEVIGELGFYEYEKKHRKAEIGYKLARKYWRKGIMSEAMDGVLSYIYNETDINRLQALVDPRNTGSIKLLEKKGFQREGLLRDYEYERGDYIDLIMFSILRREVENT